MLYKRKDEKKLDPKLFEDPSSEYRGFPFWAWNGKGQMALGSCRRESIR
jgi:hypothetical protein